MRARARGSFLGGIVAIIFGNLLVGRKSFLIPHSIESKCGKLFIDNSKVALKLRSRWSFFVIMTLQGAWWTWGNILVTQYRETHPTYDWATPGFGNPFALLLCWVGSFQAKYMYLYFVVGNLARDEGEVVRTAAMLRGTESAAQAVSYGLNSIKIFAAVGGVYLNFGLWAISLLPAWVVIKDFGTPRNADNKVKRELVENDIAVQQTVEGVSSEESLKV